MDYHICRRQHVGDNMKFRQSKEFIQFLEKLPKKDQQKLIAMIKTVQNHGLQTAIRMKWIKKLDKDLYEIRSKQGTNIQRAIYFQIKDEYYYITHSFTKKTQQTPKKEINKAKRIRSQFKEKGED